MKAPNGRTVIVFLGLIVFGVSALPAQQEQKAAGGAGLYRAACAACHGADGMGPPSARKLAVPTPDLTDCSFASREPDADWMAVVHQGGPVRRFDPAMPAFGESLSEGEIQAILDHIRTLCTDARWPRGELNLPRTFFIEKAYPEDEAVSTLSVTADGPGRVLNEVIYEKRFGATSQIELKVPFGAQEQLPGGWRGGLGDVVLGVKQVLYHSLQNGTILSLGAELQLPTGTRSAGMSSGTYIAEPFLTIGKILPRDAFLQFIAEAELPFEAKTEREAAAGIALGKSWTQGQWGRTWTPMLELLGARELEAGARLEWDVVPQIQVSLARRQHVLANIGARIPVNGSGRASQLLVYVLWDWFDGGFFDGW